MAQAGTIRVFGFTELAQACIHGEADTKREFDGAVRKIGDIVREDATRRFTPVDSHSAAGYRTRVRVRGVAVEQSLRKTTGKHPKYGGLQMRRALLPALYSNQDRLESETQHALDVIGHRFEAG